MISVLGQMVQERTLRCWKGNLKATVFHQKKIAKIRRKTPCKDICTTTFYLPLLSLIAAGMWVWGIIVPPISFLTLGIKMKLPVMCCLAMLFLMSASSCVTKKIAPRSCSTLNIVYVNSVPGEQGVDPEGIFSITNTGNVPVNLPLVPGSSHHIHSQIATTEERSSNNGSWRMFNPALEEVMGWSRHMTIKPGQTKNIAYYANGLFYGDPPDGDMEYSIVVTDLAGCTYRSEPFKR